jgi:hypothetical protein
MKKSILLYFIIILLIACNKKYNKQENRLAFQEAEVTDDRTLNAKSVDINENNNDVKPVIDKKKIIKNGNISIKVEDLNAARKNVDSLVKIFNAYYANENYSNNETSESYYLTIKIPAENFENFINTFEKKFSEIIYKNIIAQDVTEEYIDLESRLQTKQSYIKKYMQLLKKAGSVKDILEIEEKTRIIQEEIESVEGRMKYLDDQVNYSKLELTILRDKEFIIKPVSKINFFERLIQSVLNGWQYILLFIVYIFKFWAFIIIAIVLYFVIKKMRKRKKDSINVQ